MEFLPSVFRFLSFGNRWRSISKALNSRLHKQKFLGFRNPEYFHWAITQSSSDLACNFKVSLNKKCPALKICSILLYFLPYYSFSVLFNAKLIDVLIQFQIGAVSASEEFRLGVSLNADLKRKFENLCVWP